MPYTTEVKQGRAWNPNGDSVFVLDVSAKELGNNRAEIRLEATFDRVPIQNGTFIRGEYYQGCKSARLSCLSSGEVLVDHTKGETLRATYTLSKSTTSARKFSPEVPLTSDTPATDATLKIGSVGTTTKEMRETEFSGTEYALSASTTGRIKVVWEVAERRVAKQVRDFLSGNLTLSATYEGVNGPPACVTCIARPFGVTILNSRYEELKGLASLALRASAFCQGAKLPKVLSEIIIEVKTT